MELPIKQEAVQKKDTELEVFLIDVQPTPEPKVLCSYSCLNRAGVTFNIVLVIGLSIVIIWICLKMSLEN